MVFWKWKWRGLFFPHFPPTQIMQHAILLQESLQWASKMNSWEFQIDWSCGHGDMTQTNQGIFWLIFENRHFSRRLFCWPISITSSFSINLVNTLFESLEPVLLTRVKIRTVWPLACPWLVDQDQVVLFDQPRTREWSNGSDFYSSQKYRF